ncbi:hypothetical protein M0804_010732 [Polistes exclamans]|nr:hypothetical protein M0804_010732 [Polistes exclamans]
MPWYEEETPAVAAATTTDEEVVKKMHTAIQRYISIRTIVLSTVKPVHGSTALTVPIHYRNRGHFRLTTLLWNGD